MEARSIGFVGGGRVARILLSGLERASALPPRCVVADADQQVLDELHARFPGIRLVGDDLGAAAQQEVVFGALHPPALKDALPRIGEALQAEAVFISLAPIMRLGALQDALGGRVRVARMIPNVGSMLGVGFNPVSFAPGVGADTRQRVRQWLGALGECPEVPDEQLEAYAILTAMGPTYFWFQFEELEKLGQRFGLNQEATRHALRRMLEGGVKTFFQSGLRPEEVIDLVPAKPLEASAGIVREAYQTQLTGLYARLTHAE